MPPEAETVSLVVRWRAGKASVAEVHALRRVFAEFRDTSVSELMATVAGTPTVPVHGTFPRPFAERLRSEAGANGLVLEIVPLDQVTT
jgi:hypothetical protein